MKKFLILAMGLTLLAGNVEKAHAYSSNTGADPIQDDPGQGFTGYGDLETKVYRKSATAGKSASLVARRVLAYSSEADGYTLTRMVTRTPAGLRQLACVSMDTVATGDTAYHRCITKGYVRLQYDGTTYPIEAGVNACVNAEGIVTGCALSAEATVETGIVPLESKSGLGNYLKAIVNLR